MVHARIKVNDPLSQTAVSSTVEEVDKPSGAYKQEVCPKRQWPLCVRVRTTRGIMPSNVSGCQYLLPLDVSRRTAEWYGLYRLDTEDASVVITSTLHTLYITSLLN